MPLSDPLMPLSGRIITLGQFIIDQFEHRNVQTGEVVEDHPPEQIGGGGTYAILGGRQFLPASALGMIVDEGADFPPAFREALEAFGREMWWFRPRRGPRGEEEATTRALNIYAGEERGEGYQSFRYLTPRKRISPLDLPPSPFVTPEQGPPAGLHFVCGPERAEAIVDEVRQLGWERTKLIWEPMPPDCTPVNRPAIQAASRHMTVLSPNHLEALALFGLEPAPLSTTSLDGGGGGGEGSGPLRRQIEDVTREMASWLARTTPCQSLDGSSPAALSSSSSSSNNERERRESRVVVVRCGPLGVCFAFPSSTSDPSTTTTTTAVRWLPAVFGADEQGRVRDVTGGGNAFLGGMAAGLKLTGGDAYRAILFGSVAASFAIEQAGLPSLDAPPPNPVAAAFPPGGGGGKAAPPPVDDERWNGSESGWQRLERYEVLVEGGLLAKATGAGAGAGAAGSGPAV